MAMPYSNQQSQEMGWAQQASAAGLNQPIKQDRNPDAITSKLDQLIFGLNGSLFAVEQIQRKLFGARPEAVASNISNAAEPPASMQIDMLQAKVTELQRSLELISQAL